MSALAHFISCNLCASFVRRGQRLSQKLHRLLLSQLGRLHRTHLIDMSDHICLFLIKWEQICLEIILIRLATTVFTDLLILVNFIPTSVCLLVYKLSATLIRFDRMLRDWHNPGLRHHDRGLVHIWLFFEDHGHLRQVFSQNSTPRRQSILYQVIMELQHNHESLFHFPISDHKCKQFQKVKDDLDSDWNDLRCNLLLFELVRVVNLTRADLDIFIKSEKNDESTVDDADNSEGKMAIESCFLLLNHSINFYDTFVVCDECTEKQEADGTHESSDFEHDYAPVLIVCFKLWWNYVSMEDQTVSQYYCQRWAYLSYETTHCEKEKICDANWHNDFGQSIHRF